MYVFKLFCGVLNSFFCFVFCTNNIVSSFSIGLEVILEQNHDEQYLLKNICLVVTYMYLVITIATGTF